MGIRFACHQCGKRLNIKRDLAGKRGVCPDCQARFRIPATDTDVAEPLSVNAVTHSSRQANSNGHAGSSVDLTSAQASGDAGQATAPTPELSTETASGLADAPQTVPATSSVATMDSLALMDEDSTATWYVRPPAGGQYGPADSATLRQWMDQGRIASNSLLWRDGWAQWRMALEALPDFESRMASPAEAAAGGNESVATQTPTTKQTAPATSDSAAAVRPGLSGQADLGMQKSKLQNRRVQTISLLAALVVGLVGVLGYLLLR